MAREIVVNNQTFNIPEPGQDPGWGLETTDWMEEVSDVLNTLQGNGDIIETDFVLGNNQTSAANISGLSFDNSTVRAAIIEYAIHRTTDSVTSGKTETGLIKAFYDANASSPWQFSLERIGNSGITFSITNTGSSGQFQYTSSNLSGANYSGKITFKARTVSS